ncbi:MAG: prepilin-type N-terminal cleavage/methylation domain-containing protein [Thiohalomonadaceae bacterium]
MDKQSGFTLIEIAIVLVIIGLLLGGIIKGQEMIDNARIRNLRSDFEGIAAALHAYRDRYQRVPGDDERADRWSGGTVGNGDSYLEDRNDAFDVGPIGNHERRWFWQHLRRAGLLKGDPADANHPSHAFGGQFGVVSGNGNNPLGLNGPVVLCASMVPLKAAEALDMQLDDGRPDTGDIRAQAQTSAATDPGNAGTVAARYAEAVGTTYAVCQAL